MKMNEVMEIAKWFNESELTVFKWKEDESELKLEKNHQVMVATEQILPMKTVSEAERVVPVVKEAVEMPKSEKEEATEVGVVIKSPVVGTFYSSPSPEEGSFVEVGQRVKKGDVVCIVEAMKLLNEITSPVDGVVKEIFVENEDLLEFEQKIMRIEP